MADRRASLEVVPFILSLTFDCQGQKKPFLFGNNENYIKCYSLKNTQNTTAFSQVTTTQLMPKMLKHLHPLVQFYEALEKHQNFSSAVPTFY